MVHLLHSPCDRGLFQGIARQELSLVAEFVRHWVPRRSDSCLRLISRVGEMSVRQPDQLTVPEFFWLSEGRRAILTDDSKVVA